MIILEEFNEHKRGSIQVIAKLLYLTFTTISFHLKKVIQPVPIVIPELQYKAGVPNPKETH